MSINTDIKRFPTATFENFLVSGVALDHETMTKTDLPTISVLVNVNHDDPETFVDRQYRAALQAQGYITDPSIVGKVQIDSYGTDGVAL